MRRYLQHFPLHAGKRWVWSRLSRYFEWCEYAFVTPTFFGAEMAGDVHNLIDHCVYYFGLWEPNFTAFLGRRLLRGDLFVDVGANIGYHTLWASHLVGDTGSVVAIEASPRIFGQLTSNIARNHVGNVRAINVAASDRPGTLKLYRGPDGNPGATTIVGDDPEKLEQEVPALPLHQILRPDEIRRARVVKIDVEGAEWLAIAGLGPLLSTGRKDLEVFVEVDPERLAEMGHSSDEIVQIFREAGLHPYALPNDYSSASYIPPRTLVPPTRIEGPITAQADIVFSRVDAAQL